MLKTCVAFAVAIVLIICPLITLGRVPELVNNGFQGVIVSIGSDIEADAKATMDNIVNALKTLIQNASIELYAATGNRAYFYNVTVLIPSTWSAWQNTEQHSTDDVNVIVTLDQTRFHKADIRLNSPNAAYGDFPYVQQPGSCGETGDFIHITKNFVFNPDNPALGTKARLLARAWIMYYFGVYDEHGYDYNSMYPPMYFDSKGLMKYSSCSNADVNYQSFACIGTSPVAGIPNSCTAELDPSSNQNIISSLMTLPIVPLANKVCTNDSHNSEAPSKHNIMCNGKSIMDIILQNNQFKDGKNLALSADHPPITTMINDLQVSPNIRIALYVVWDIPNQEIISFSGSPAIFKFIQVDIPNGSYFGLTATTENPIISKIFMKIENQQNRDTIFQDLKSSQMEITHGSVVEAVQIATEKLNSLSQSDYIGAILIITDDVNPLTWKQICATANDRDYPVHLITYTSETVVQYVSNRCQGSQTIVKALVQPPTDLLAITKPEMKDYLKSCFKQLQERQQMDQALRKLPSTILPNIYSPPIVYKDMMFINGTTGTFTIDDITKTSINSNFYVETCLNSDTYPYTALLTCTVGTELCKSISSNPTKSLCTGVPLTASTYWNFTCELLMSDLPVPYVVNVVGKPTAAATVSADNQPIQLYSWILYDTQANKQYTPVRIFASLKKGTSPVFNSNVVAFVKGDNSDNFTTITLSDDGSGNPDATAQDGVYSAYFTQFGTSGAYSVNVRATDNNGAAKVPTKQYPWITHDNDMGLISTEKFSRESTAGSFVGSASGFNVIEPGRILDLKVQSSVGPTVTLAWTAPGDDLDWGKVQKYIIKCSTNKNDLSATSFGTGEQASNLPTVTPESAKTKQTATITGSIDGVTHYCAIKSFDGIGYSQPSNIVSYYMEPSGMTTAQKAGISLGVVFGIIFIIVIFLLLWCCYCKKNKADQKSDVKTNGNDQRPISQVTSANYQPVPQLELEPKKNVVTYRPSYTTTDETAIPLKRSNTGGSQSSMNSNSRNTTAATAVVQDSRTPSPKPIMFRDGGGSLYPNVYGNNRDSSSEDDDDNVIDCDAEVAVPQILTKTAMLQDTKVYRDFPKVPPKPTLQPDVQKYSMLLPGTPSPNPSSHSRSAQV